MSQCQGSNNQRASREGSCKPCLHSASQPNVLTEHEMLRADTVPGSVIDRVQYHRGPRSNKRAKNHAFFAAGDLEVTWMSLVTF